MKRKFWWNTAFCRTPVVRGYNEYSHKITQPVTIALVTDLHSTRYGDRQEALLRGLRKYQPDLILMAGDIADDQVPLDGTREFLAGIEGWRADGGTGGGPAGEENGRYPAGRGNGGAQTVSAPLCFYVSGNHEQRTGRLGSLKKLFSSHGVTVLSGETRTVNVRGQLLEIGGVDDPTVFTCNRYVRRIPSQWKRQLFSCRSTLSPERYSILISHRPELTRFYRRSGFDLVTAGHAHGGQVRLPGLPGGLLAPHQGLFPRYAGGRYRLGPTTLIVSRGLCLNHLPRICNPPELVVIRLLPAQASSGAAFCQPESLA